MIGANNYGFADIVTRCVTNWATSPTWWKNYCSDDSDMTSRFTSARIATETTNVRDALLRVRDAMTNAGYAASQYTILAQTYWSPLPRGAQIRYSESGWTRQTVGGCGVWNRDADWANDVVVNALNTTTRNAAATSGLANVKVLDLQTALNGRRLCENTVGLLEEKGVAAWKSAGRGRQDRMGRADPHDVDDLRPLPAAGGQPRELLGPAGDAQLPAPGLQRRRGARRRVRAVRQRADEPRRAGDGAAVAGASCGARRRARPLGA